MKEAIEVNWKLIGAELATLSDEDQANFFEGFCVELSNYDTHVHREMQFMMAGDKMSESAKKTAEKYFPALWYKSV